MSVEPGLSPRPALHFTPAEGWMNDPNGMFYRDGLWHLFYQHNPEAPVWGDIHWGHATSRDLLTWEVHPAALAPSEHGVAASGCVVVDHDNTSGFGELGVTPVVALFTHMPQGGPQVQSLAFSLDGGETFAEWSGNPFLVDPDEPDFRDPKVIFVPAVDAWVMTLAVGQRIRLFTSTNLVDWTVLQTFGEHEGAHGGVWECPDLFPLPDPHGGPERWVLLVSVQEGAPNHGSGMQYFVGQMTPEGFVSEGGPAPRWLDWGTDCYAGVTFFDAPDSRKVMIGWMSNWYYALETPTKEYRGAMTLPRELSLVRTEAGIEVVQRPVPELDARRGEPFETVAPLVGPTTVVGGTGVDDLLLELTVPRDVLEIVVVGHSGDGHDLRIVVQRDGSILEVDRSDLVPAGSKLAARIRAPVTFDGDQLSLRFVVDATSVELFASGGRHVVTFQIHPHAPLTDWTVRASSDGASMRALLWPLRPAP